MYRSFSFFPALTWMQRLLLLVNGTSNVTADNAKTFLCNPLTWVVLFFMCVIMTVCAMFERFAITDALHASRCGLHKTARQMFSTGFDLCVERFRPSNWGLIFYALIILHFGSILDISSITTFIHVPGYILEDFELHPYKKVRCVYSTEQAQRCEARGSLMQVTAVFGCTLASMVIEDIRKNG